MTLGNSVGTKPNVIRVWQKRLLLFCLAITGIVAFCVYAAPPGFQAYPLQHASPDEVVPQLRKQLLALASDARVYSDQQSNQVLVQGSEATQQLAAKIVKTLDQPGRAGADPAARSQEVKGYRVEGDLSEIVKRLQQRFPARSGVRISADERTRQVIVIAPSEVQREVDQILQAHRPAPTEPKPLPNPPVNPVAQDLVHRLRNITWRDLESELVRLWGDQLEVTRARNGEIVNVSIAGAKGSQPVIQIDRRSGEVSFTGTGDSVTHWRRIIEAVDSQQDGEQLIQLVPIRNAEPLFVHSTVAYLNQIAESTEDEVTQGVPLSRSGKKRNPADLVVSMLYQQEQTKTAQAAAPAQPAAAGQPPAAPAQPGRPAAQPAPPGAAPGEPVDANNLGLMGPVTVEIVGDTVILKGNKSDVERVKKLIEDIDRITGLTQPKIEVYELQNINADAATTLVTEIFNEILADRTGQVTIRSLGEPNAILLIGREQSIEVVKNLIQQIDKPSPPSSRFEVFRLKHVSALDAEQTVRGFFVDRPGQSTNPRTGIGIRVQVVGEVRTNSLIVQASPRDMEEVRRLIASIDIAEPSSSAELRVFKLKNTLAETLATVLQSAISGQGATTGGQQPAGQGQPPQQQQGGTTQGQPRLPSAALEFMMIDQTGGRLLRSGILTDVQVTADPNNNSLIVRAPSKSMELIAALIEQLDRLPDASASVKVFEIVNGNATTLAQMLQTLFGQQATAGQGNNALTSIFGGQQQLQTGTAGGESSLVPLRFAVDQRTNSIIASGSEADLQVVGTILLRLDESRDDRRLEVIRLRNTQAASVATAVQQYLTNLQQQVQQQLLSQQQLSAFESVERQVFVVPENVTNSLIVSATPRYMEEILRVVKELDVRPPMVMVQVLIAEVILDNTFEFGTEFGFQDSLMFDRGKAVGSPPGSDNQAIPGFNFLPSIVNPGSNSLPNVRSYQQEALAGQGLSSFAMGRTSGVVPYGGLVLSAASESINILLRALQDEQKLQILSRPQIMTMHNQPAFVQVGANVARPGAITISNNIAQQSFNYEDTGLILSILPLINDDGMIVMGIEAQRSALGDESDPNAQEIISADGSVSIIKPLNITQASTTISARDGQTVVFAGLITKTNRFELRRIPYLSDVPVLGNLFQFQSNSETRTELLVVMTPHLVRSEDDVKRINFEESSRMSWCLADVVNVTGEWGLQGGNCAFCNTDTPLIFPDVDPTGTTISPTPAPVLPPAPPVPGTATPPPLTNPSSSTDNGNSSRREASMQPIPLPARDGNSSPNEVTPTSYRVMRLPTTK